MKMASKRLIGAGLSTGLLLATLAGNAAASEGYGGDKDRGGSSQKGRASSYINPDTAAATANPDVDPGSNCYNPDQRDRQRFSDVGTANRNVHNDACFLDRAGNKFDGPATFESTGVGFISACPDPDGAAGPKVAMLSDTNGDGRKDRCFQSGYQDTGLAGDDEFHARMNNTGLRHVLLEDYRHEARQQRATCATHYRPVEADGPLETVLQRDEAVRVRQAFERLSVQEQELLELRAVAGLSAEGAAEVLGKRPGTIRMAQHRATVRLRVLFNEGAHGHHVERSTTGRPLMRHRPELRTSILPGT